MIIKKVVCLIHLLNLINCSLHPLFNLHETKSSNCIGDILNTIPLKDVHFLVITKHFENKFFFPFYGVRAFNELSQENLRSYTVLSSSNLIVNKCIKHHEINVYLIFLNENENFAAILKVLMNLCTWNPIAKIFIIIRHYESIRQNHVYFELFRKLIFNVIIIEISAMEQNLITVNILVFVCNK